MIQWVQRPTQFPGTCAVLPIVGGTHPAGYFDTGQTNGASHSRVYVSVVAAVQMAEMLGFRRGAAPDAARLRALEARVVELEAEVSDRDEQLAAVGTLRLAGATAGRRSKAAA